MQFKIFKDFFYLSKKVNQKRKQAYEDDLNPGGHAFTLLLTIVAQ